MANRKGVFIGAYVPNHLKESLRRRAAAEHRTLSQEITRILVEAVHGKGLPAEVIQIAKQFAVQRAHDSLTMPDRGQRTSAGCTSSERSCRRKAK